MPSKVSFFLLGIMMSFTVFAETDTLVFRSSFEERIILQAINKKNPDLITLFSVINTDSAAATQYDVRLNKFYASLDDKVDATKSNKQKARVIFKEVHDYFLNQYEEHTSFNNIFENGRYNCVTASMLYSIVLKRYGVPYAIKEKPTHVYLVAFPGGENILYETTNPKGFFVPDERQKKAYVDGLIAVKFTTQEHVSNVGVSKAFNEFYYNNDNIDEIQLAALQYMNFALNDFYNDRHEDAVTHIVKTNLLFPSAKHQFLQLDIIGTALANSKFDSPRDVMYMSEYANACRDIADKKRAVTMFGDIIRKRLIQNDDQAFVVNAFAICKEKIRDTTVVKEISYDYYYAMAYAQATKSDWTTSLEYANHAFKINPKNINLQELILRGVMLRADGMPANEKASTVEGYAETYPFLRNNKTYKALLIYAYAFESYTKFSQNAEVDGYSYMKKAEAAMKSDWTKMPLLDQMIGLMYAEAGAYHFRKKQYAKAKEILLEGLKVAPNHSEINARLEIVEDENMRPSRP